MDRADKHRIFSNLFTIRNRWKNVLYIHIPFCLQRCRFCVYFSKVPDSRGEVTHFVERDLARQIDDYAEVLSTVTFSELYIGGGTPTVMSPASLERLLAQIPGLNSIALKAIEASPRSLRAEHIDVLAAHGFSYVSIGLQTFDIETLRRENRELAEPDRVAAMLQRLKAAGILTNIDLIFFLATGTMADLGQAEIDLRRVMEELAPASITVHSNYHASKSKEKQLAMIRLVRAATERSPEYMCTNSLLDEADADADARDGAEYRLMRRDLRNFTFHLLGKVPQAMRFGYNVLGLGEYELFKLRSNYFGVSDFYPRHAQAGVLMAARTAELQLSNVRMRLNLSHSRLEDLDNFFEDRTGRIAYERALQAEGFPEPVFQDLAH
ncbi:radical SAM protein [Rhizobium laguerreae]|uniref:radical SAM protein n=1 Tax=Rhizobium laguerreae TaxID=1076926 RepID=UPI001C90CE99|nr:radical SAM protein [Rhizobium laguerreae]MBY3203459.1 radical SAM protein [Rhizobium laguerreae]